MNKKEFVKVLSLRSNLSEVKCKSLLNEIKSIIFENLRTGEDVRFAGFGRFFVKYKKERLCYFKKQTKLLPAKNVAKFTLSNCFKNIVR